MTASGRPRPLCHTRGAPRGGRRARVEGRPSAGGRGIVCAFFFFFLNDPAPPEIYPLPLPDALPISLPPQAPRHCVVPQNASGQMIVWPGEDRKSTRLNSSHGSISYAVFCLTQK